MAIKRKASPYKVQFYPEKEMYSHKEDRCGPSKEVICLKNDMWYQNRTNVALKDTRVALKKDRYDMKRNGAGLKRTDVT
jgi:hypothetical protein